MRVKPTVNPKGFHILEATEPKELSYLNYLIREGKALASGDKYYVFVCLKDGKTTEDFKSFLRKKGFKVE